MTSEAFVEEAEGKLSAFQSHVRMIKGVSLKLEELTKLFRSNEVSKSVYESLRDELGSQLSALVRELFELRKNLELARAKARLEWTKERIGLAEWTEKMRAQGSEPLFRSDYSMQKSAYAPIHRWEGLIADVDAALTSLSLEEELSIAEQYLLLTREGIPQTSPEEIEESERACRQRLDSISERWTSTRSGKVEEITNLELKASQVREQIREAEVRFAVGEFDEAAYENQVGSLKGALRRLEKEASEARSYVDEMDMKVFKCLELMKGGGP